jgi:hypothetical protein
MRRVVPWVVLPLVLASVVGVGRAGVVHAFTPTLQYEIQNEGFGCLFGQTCNPKTFVGLSFSASIDAENFRGVQAGTPDYLSALCERWFTDAGGVKHVTLGEGIAWDAFFRTPSRGTITGWAGVNYPGVPAFGNDSFYSPTGSDALTNAGAFVHDTLTDPFFKTVITIDGGSYTNNRTEDTNAYSPGYSITVTGLLRNYTYSGGILVFTGTSQGQLYCTAGTPGNFGENEYDYGDVD